MSEHIEQVNAILAGDQGAFRKFYEEHKSWLYAVCMRYCGNANDANDAFQEVFVKIYEGLHQYSLQGSIHGWMKRVAVNVILGKAREKNAKVHQYNQDIEELHNLSSEIELLAELNAEEIRSCIAELPEGRRLVFNAYCIEGFSHQEIAEQLGISVGTSKSQLSDARKELRKILELRGISVQNDWS